MLNQGEKANVLCLDLLKEAVDLQGKLNVLRVDHTEDVGGNAVLQEELIPSHHLPMSGLLGFGDAVPVMNFPWPIKAQSNREALRRKKAAPVLIEEGAVCLDAIGNNPVRRTDACVARPQCCESSPSPVMWVLHRARKT